MSFVSIRLDTERNIPLYIQLFEKIEEKIKEDTLEPGVRLPSIRKMAKQLSVNSVTVVNAYKMLEREGYVYSKAGSGFYIGHENMGDKIVEKDKLRVKEEFFDEKDIQWMSQGQITINPNSINFATATPAPELFPVEHFKEALIEVLERDKGQAFGYHESNGYRPLRHSISEFVKSNYSIDADQEHIQIISGAQQGIDVIAKALIDPDDYVFVENPTYTGAIAVFKSRGAKIIGISIHEDGIDIEKLEEYIQRYKPKIIYTMPNYQNPTTYSYSYEKKNLLLELAYKYNFYIIEDDFLSDLDFNLKSSNKTLKSMDKGGRVLYIKSFSKVLMPGLRIGFLITPQEIFKKILQAKHSTDISSSGLIQRALDIYLRKGIWGKHLEYMRDIYKDRYQRVIQAVKPLENIGVKIYYPDGGLNLWLTLPQNISATQLYYECEKRNLLITPGKIFYTQNPDNHDNNIRLSYAAVYPEQIEKGVKILYNCIQNLQNKNTQEDIYYSPLI